jgi:arabinan endo-1,5-alpha-L-arabinosidase
MKIFGGNFRSGRRKALRHLGSMGVAAISGAIARPLLGKSAESPPQSNSPAFRVGAFNKIYDPSIGEKEKWYINDHTFVHGDDGLWHLFGITHREPANPEEEKFFAHATARNLMGPWKKHPPVLQADEKSSETFVWAPYVFKHDGQYWMYYCGGGKGHAKYHIQLATSPDLWNWKRHSANPMVVDGYDARDPMVFRLEDNWVLYYAATSTPEGGNHTVDAVFSKDLVHWSGKREVFRDSEVGTYGGPTESPFVVRRGGKYFLFVCTNHGYNETAVYESKTPLHWDTSRLVGKFPSHAAEVIQTPDGKWFVSRAGWGQGGVYLAELNWQR